MAGTGQLCFTPGQGLFPAKALEEEEGRKLWVETHFCCTSGAAAHPSPRVV